MSSFKPVDLLDRDGNSYLARSAVDLNDRIAEGYTRAPERKPTPTPRASFTVAPESNSESQASDSN